MTRRILSVFGTRPEAIKMAPVVAELSRRETIDSRVCVTGQHREMLEPVLDLFGIVPDRNLEVMRVGQDLTDITCNVLLGLREVLRIEKPDLVLVHGDTTSTLAGSLAAYYEMIPVGHVEAGLRTGDIYAPWPEEINRRLTDAVASLHFAPTDAAAQVLLDEGADPGCVWVTGNTVIDALVQVSGAIASSSELGSRFRQQYSFLDEGKRLILVTGHRRENLGEGHAHVCEALRRLALRGDVQVVYAVHLNPGVRDVVESILSGVDGVYLIGPQDYLSFVYLLERAHIVITDSGGVQEEAPSLGTPVLVTRQKTERPEAVAAGTAVLVGTDTGAIVTAASELLDDPSAHARMKSRANPYGDGNAALRIADILEAWA